MPFQNLSTHVHAPTLPVPIKRPNVVATVDSPSVKPSLTEWNSLEKLVKMCSKLQWQRGVTIAYEYIETLEEQLDTIAVPPTSYIYFLNMMFDKVKHEHMIKWVNSTLISRGANQVSMSWNESKAAFIKQYGDINAMTILRDRLRLLTQGKLSVQEYSEEFQRLTRRLGHEFKDDNKSNMDAYLRGLNSDIKALMINVRKTERNRPGGNRDWDWLTLTELCLATINTAGVEADAKHSLNLRESSNSSSRLPRADSHPHGNKRKADRDIQKPTGLHCPQHPHLDNHTWEHCILNPNKKNKDKTSDTTKHKKAKHTGNGSHKQQRHSSKRSHDSASGSKSSSNTSNSSDPSSPASPLQTKRQEEKADKKVKVTQSHAHLTCYSCGVKGHISLDCPGKGKGATTARTPAVRSVTTPASPKTSRRARFTKQSQDE